MLPLTRSVTTAITSSIAPIRWSMVSRSLEQNWQEISITVLLWHNQHTRPEQRAEIVSGTYRSVIVRFWTAVVRSSKVKLIKKKRVQVEEVTYMRSRELRQMAYPAHHYGHNVSQSMCSSHLPGKISQLSGIWSLEINSVRNTDVMPWAIVVEWIILSCWWLTDFFNQRIKLLPGTQGYDENFRWCHKGRQW